MDTNHSNLSKNQDIFTISYVFERFVDETDLKKQTKLEVYSPSLGVIMKVYTNSDRYILFKKKGCTCVSCGLKASHFLLVHDRNNPTFAHFQLVGITDKNEYVLFTKDHIVPRYLGGKNHIDNYQTMCYDCNNKKQTECDIDIYNTGLNNKTIKIQPITFSLPKSLSNSKSIELLYKWIEMHGWKLIPDPSRANGFIVETNIRTASKYITNTLPIIKDLMNITNQQLNKLDKTLVLSTQNKQKMTFIQKLKFLFT